MVLVFSAATGCHSGALLESSPGGERDMTFDPLEELCTLDREDGFDAQFGTDTWSAADTSKATFLHPWGPQGIDPDPDPVIAVQKTIDGQYSFALYSNF